MAIQTLDQLIAAPKQVIPFVKTASLTTVAAAPFSVFGQAGNPGAGTLAGTSTTNGVVPDDTTAGFPALNAFAGGATGYISSVDFGSSVACRLTLSDCLFKAGAYSFNSNVTLSSQPSYASRVPGGTDFKGTQIWLEAVTTFTGNLTITVTYTNQDGVAGRSTGAVATGIAPIASRMIQLPLQAGDSGVQKIESVVASNSSSGTFNILVLRPLWSGRVRSANDGGSHGFDITGLAQVFDTSALFLQVTADSTASGIPELQIEVANG